VSRQQCNPSATGRSRRRATRHGHHIRDTQIGGIITARRAKSAIRNTKHFSDLTVGAVNPWELN
jgi:predicted nucleic acid-binding protein